MSKQPPAPAVYARIREVAANWLIGREIVEEEQKGRLRAAYGE